MKDVLLNFQRIIFKWLILFNTFYVISPQPICFSPKTEVDIFLLYSSTISKIHLVVKTVLVLLAIDAISFCLLSVETTSNVIILNKLSKECVYCS